MSPSLCHARTEMFSKVVRYLQTDNEVQRLNYKLL